MVELTPFIIAVCGISLFAGYVVRAISGFGSTLVALPLMVYVVPIHAAVPLNAALGLVAIGFAAWHDRRFVIGAELRALLPANIVGVATGIYIFSRLDSVVLPKILGGFVVVYAIYVLVSDIRRIAPGTCTMRWAAPVSFIGATVDSLFGGGGGMLVAMYMHRRGYDQRSFRATLCVLWTIELVLRVVGYGVGGYYDRGTILLFLLMLPAMALGEWVGLRVTKRMSHRAFTRFLAVVMAGCGTSLMLK